MPTTAGSRSAGSSQTRSPRLVDLSEPIELTTELT